MKLMKHITIALVLCAIPAMAFGQTVSCDDCSHTVSVYSGGGGLIATADDADMVSYVATCGGLTRHGELAANDDGVVSTLFTMANGLACHSEGGSFRLGPIMDGGWYWITDDANSAVGNLVAEDILDNTTVDITSAGDSVTPTMGKGAVYLKHTASGRVGILPNILPEPPMDPATVCGAYRKADKTVAQVTSGCMLGDGSTKVRIVGPGDFGRTSETLGSATVYRNTTVANSVTLDLWTTGGMVSTDTSDGATPVGTGYAGLGVALGLADAADGVSATVGGGVGVSLLGALGSGNENLAVTDGDSSVTPATNDRVEITFEDATNSAYCTATSSTDAVLTVKLVSDQADVMPAVKNLGTTAAAYHGTATVTIKCPPPAAGANMGTELVPDNPFPTDK